MSALSTDVRHALRRLGRSPAFTAIVLLTLAFGIGANTAIFSVVDAVLLRPLPYREPDRLVTVEHLYPSLKGLQTPVSAPGFADYRDRTRVFSHVAIETWWNPNLTGAGDPQRLTGARVSGQWFATFGVAPALGRALRPDEDAPGRQFVVVLSDALWRRQFGADPGIVGKTVALNGESHEVVGVMPPGFRDVIDRGIELWRPLALPESQYTGTGRTNEWLVLTARLKPGVTTEQAGAELRTLAEQLKQQYPDSYPPDWSLVATSWREKGTGKVRPALLILLGAVGFVLLIACANVANLLLARGAGRAKEVAIRAALGAKRAHLVRQLLVESVLLAVGGGVLGLALAWAGVRALGASEAVRLPGETIGVNATVMAFTLVVALATGIVFGLFPALQTTRTDLQGTLRDGGRGTAGDRGGQAVRRALVVAEVALALVLLAGAGLLTKSFARLQGVDPGFSPEGVLTTTIALPSAKYRGDTARLAFYDQLLPRLAATPGVRAVGTVNTLPFGGGGSTASFSVEGHEPAADQPGPWGDYRVVSPGFLQAIRAPLVRGRHLTDQDGPGAPRVAIVDSELANRYWPKQDPIGKRIAYGGAGPDGQQSWITVVGVVGHVKQEGLDAEPRAQVYLPYRQNAGSGTLSLVVRTAGDPLRLVPTVREAVKAVDKDVPLANVASMESLLEKSVGQRRLSMLLIALFSAVALLMACVGIYGVMSYAVAQRTREMGVRVALGAKRSDVLGLVLREGMGIALLGVALGLAGAFALTRLIQSQLYDVKASDPSTYVLVALLLALTTLAATLVPALRATRVDPMVALREE